MLAEMRPCIQIFFTEMQHKNFHFALSRQCVLVAFGFAVVAVAFPAPVSSLDFIDSV